jgi:predicted amidophosphoribosyltransferase
MTIQINVQWLSGNWRYGWALDLHTVSSTPLPEGGFETQRTEVGELLYQLKYCLDRSKVEPIAEAAAAFLRSRMVLPYLAAIIPVPPSDTNRPFQPVQELAVRIGQKINLPVRLDYLVKVKLTEALKGIEDSASRKQQLQGAFKVQDLSLAGKYVLVFDDLFRSGETLKAITEVLYAQGKVARVYVLTITKTRTRR